jgi:hypothetical protein
MTNDGKKNLTDRIARIISVVFHPILVPVYGMVIILTAPTLYNFIPFEVKKLLILIILINNVLLPLSLLPFFIHRNFISSWSITSRRDRNIPLVISTILYVVTTIIMYRFHIPFFLKAYFLAVAFISLIATLVNFVWKISLHAIGAGTLLSIILILSIRMYTPLVWFIIPSMLAGGLILSSRLKLNLHNPGQVWTGYLTGLVGFMMIILMVQQFS